MPALAINSSTQQMKQSLNERKLALANANSDISVITRIDYNLRFTKQAILVISDSTDLHSTLANEFLVSLSDSHSEVSGGNTNVAFVSASLKLNDIQIRCRLIEQLFVNTLFDPEQSLAISLLAFAKDQREPISIVIDHAQSLSLQVKYELCQLVNVAKKHKIKINVVLFGLTEAAAALTINKSLVKGKLVVIDGLSGQVLSLDDKQISQTQKLTTISIMQKLGLSIAGFIICGLLVWVYFLLSQYSNVSSSSEVTATDVKNQMVLPIVTSPADVLVDEKAASSMKKKEKILLMSNQETANRTIAASSEEINSAILSLTSKKNSSQSQAEFTDVIAALAESGTKINDEISDTLTVNKPTGISSITSSEVPKITRLDEQFYLNKSLEYDEGYVIQIAGFTDKKLWQRFIEDNAEIQLYSYQKELSGNNFIVVTSTVYATKQQAKTEINLLPAVLIERQPWLKSNLSVIKEINTFK